MVRVIGKASDAVEQTVCRNCASVLEYTRSEVKAHHGMACYGGPHGMEWIDCPECHCKVVLKSW